MLAWEGCIKVGTEGERSPGCLCACGWRAHMYVITENIL